MQKQLQEQKQILRFAQDDKCGGAGFCGVPGLRSETWGTRFLVVAELRFKQEAIPKKANRKKRANQGGGDWL